MNTFMISYDLRNNRNYTDLYSALKSFSSWARVLESVWVIRTTQSAESVRDTLARTMDSDDGLIVAGLTGEAAWQNIQCSSNDLKSRLVA